MLSDISRENKLQAELVFSSFKYYFVEQEKKWVNLIKHYKEKVKYFKNLAKAILTAKNTSLFNVSEINEVLLSLRLSSENLERHKTAIKFLLEAVNEKRKTIYELSTKNKILEKELNFWLIGYDKLKTDLKVRVRP